MTISAPAKINLGLRIGAKLPSGMHRIVSTMAAITLFDTVTVSLTRVPGCMFSCSDSRLTHKNLAKKAAQLFFRVSNASGGCTVHVQKRIPAGSGLGGASSDAAAVLQALHTLTNKSFSNLQLMQLAAQLGADVPFFIKKGIQQVRQPGHYCSPTTWPINLPTTGILCVLPPRSTKEAFTHFDTSPCCTTKTYENDFQKTCFSQRPDVLTAAHTLHALGACFVSLTGSGSCVYGLFHSPPKNTPKHMHHFKVIKG